MDRTEESLAAALAGGDHQVNLGFDGLHARGQEFQSVVQALGATAFALAGDEENVRALFLPPLITAENIKKTNYLASMPNLAGEVESFQGNDKDHRRLVQALEEGGEGWEDFFSPTGLVNLPAACENLYPLYAGRLDEPVRVGLQSWCFRFEPSPDPMRMVSFRMAEQVYIGTEDGAAAHAHSWSGKLLGLLTDLGLDVDSESANDPFFGRAGRMLAGAQTENDLKHELTVQLYPTRRTALGSINLHGTMFGENFGITLADGSPAHSSCAGFGLERAAIALFAFHGMAVADWPAAVRDRLGLA
ncbi:class-II aminoacyl-tRNA synthetase family protein [Nigerium massiliense]|uniref:hypothetical protein n=1 Tax=Nigerium massiliense TaxID=1522317 RepID=UPI00058E07FA|nr:hypothetical protein [Nigerium massiliense]